MTTQEFELSQVQKWIWSEGHPAQAIALKIKGEADYRGLEKKWVELVVKYPSLRSSFIQKKEIVRGHIESRISTEVPVYTLAETPDALKNILEAPIDPEKPPLVKLSRIILPRREALLLVQWHPLILDEASVFFLLHCLSDTELSPEISSGNPCRKPQNPAKDFWKQYLEGAPLSIDLPRLPIKDKEAEVTDAGFLFSPALSELIQKTKAHTQNLSDLLIAGYAALLSRYSGQKDIVIALRDDLEPKTQVENLCPGMPPLCLRLHIPGTFNELLSHVNKQRRQVINQEPLFENTADVNLILRKDMSEALRLDGLEIEEYDLGSAVPERELSFTITVRDRSEITLPVIEEKNGSDLEDFSAAGVPSHPCKGKSSRDESIFPSRTVKVISERSLNGKNPRGRLQAPPNRFPFHFLEQMGANFQELLHGLLQHPHDPIDSIPCLSKSERGKVIRMAEGEKRPYPDKISIPAYFEQIAAKHANAIALRYEGKSLSYDQLNAKANQLARHLLSLGVKKGDFLGISLSRSFDLIIGILAIIKTGAVYVPIDVSYPFDRKSYIVQDTGMKVLLTHEADKKQFPEDTLQFLCLDTDKALFENYPGGNLIHEDIHIKAKDTIVVIYTSGSTGKPKGVELDHQGILRLVCNTNWFSIQPEDRMIQLANISFDALRLELWGPLLNGATLCIFPQKELSLTELGEFLIEEKVSHAFFTARLFNLLIEHQLHALKNIRFLASGGETMSVYHAKAALQALPHCRLVNAYGPTENSVISCAYPIERSEDIEKSVPIGPPIANTEVYILNSFLQLCPIGVIGEICLGGDGVAEGYLNRPDLTAEKFIPNPFGKGRLYRTGDYGRLLPTNDIDYSGRIDHQVKIRGFRIELGEIEGVLHEHPQVQNCLVIAREDTSGEKKLIAYVISKASQKPSSQELQDFLKSKLPAFMIPSFFVMMDTFPLTPNGKIDLKVLPSPEMTRRKVSVSERPETPLEIAISEMWSTLINIESIGKKDNFFSLGGHSITAAKLSAILSKTLNIPVPVSLIFEESTLEKYAQRIEQTLEEGKKQKSYITSADLFWIWRYREVELDPEIQVPPGKLPTSEQYAAPQKILLTGATGFVGAFMLNELLSETEAQVYCLVRAASQEEGLKRIEKALQNYRLSNPSFTHRITVLKGDLDRPFLGLEKELFDALSREIDTIFHVGALVNHALPYLKLKPPNVLGTQEILRLACNHKIKPLHFISTPDVFEWDKPCLLFEDTDIEQGRRLFNGYGQSKWVAEKLVMIARSRGLPASIYRLGRVSGDSGSGASNADDFLWRMAEAACVLKLVPEVGLNENVTPVDFACRAVRYIASRQENINMQYHVMNPRQSSYHEIFHCFKQIGYPLHFIPYHQWLHALAEMSAESDKARLQASVSLFSEIDLTHSALFAKFDCSHLLSALKGTKIQCPELDAPLLKKYIDYFISIGFLPPYKT